MYTVKVKNGDEEQYLHHPLENDVKLIDPILTLEINKTGTFEFSISNLHPFAKDIHKMSSEILVYQDDELLYVGRPLSDAINFDGISKIPCEGDLAYLLDSIQRPYDFTGSVDAFFTQLIAQHNSMVDEYKQFEKGLCTVGKELTSIHYSSSSYSDTLTICNEQLLKAHGGYLRIRHNRGKKILDYITDYAHTSSQVIRFAENILDLNQYIKSDGLITAIIPLGVETEEVSVNDTKKRLTIEQANHGKDFIYDEAAVNMFGFIYGTVTFDDISSPEKLLEAGRSYLKDTCNLSLSIELSAVDLHNIDVNIEALHVGDLIQCISNPYHLNQEFLLSSIVIALCDPASTKIMLGKSIQSFTGSVVNDKSTTQNSVKQTQESSAKYETRITQTEKVISTVSEKTDTVEKKVSSVEAKLSPEQLLVEVSKSIENGNALETTQVIIDLLGLTIKNGGLKLYDGSGNLVFYVDEKNKSMVFKGDIFGSNISTDKDLYIGNRLILGEQDDNGLLLYKSIDLSKNVHIIGSKDKNDYAQLMLNARDNVSLATGPIGGANDQYAVVSVIGDTAKMNASREINLQAEQILMNKNPTISSDLRKKHKITDIDSTFIDNLDVKGFEYKDVNGMEIGLIAQDCLDIDESEYFLNQDEEGFYSIQYSNIFCALIQYCQKLKHRIEQLEKGAGYGKYN